MIDGERRSRRAAWSRPVAAWLLLGTGLGLVIVLSGDHGAFAGQEADRSRGAEIYAVHCAACHAPDGSGRLDEAEGEAAGPPVVGLEVALVDQQLRTGRMPIVDRTVGVGGPERLDDEDREAAVAWMTDAFDLRGALPTVVEGDRTRGHELYQIHCAACHGATGLGGMGARGTVILAVVGHDEVAQVSAIRTGPYDMPRFSEEVLSDEDAAAIASFIVEDLSEAARTPVWLSESDHVTTGVLVGLVAAVLTGVLMLIGRPVRYRNEEERDAGA